MFRAVGLFLGAVVTGPSKGGLFSGSGGLFRGMFRAGRWRVHHRHKNRQVGWLVVGGGRDQNFPLSLFLLSSSLFSPFSILPSSPSTFHLKKKKEEKKERRERREAKDMAKVTTNY